jgi:hypothetical protein
MHDDDAVTITTAVKKVLHNVLSPDSVWWQEEHLMHAPVFHATVQEVKGSATQASQVPGWTASLVASMECLPVGRVLPTVVTHSK